MNTRVTNMINANGNAAVNQFILSNAKCEVFKSYNTLIAKRVYKTNSLILDRNALNHSKTTSKHLFIFLGMTRKEVERDIKLGVILIEDLNE